MSKNYIYVNADGYYEEKSTFEFNDFVASGGTGGQAGLPVKLNGSGELDRSFFDLDTTTGAAFIGTNVTNFNGILSATDINVQAALDTIDNYSSHNHNSLYYTQNEENNVRNDMNAPHGFSIINHLSADSTISFVDGTRTFTIAPTGTNFELYNKGALFLRTTNTVSFTNTEGLWFIFYSGASATPNYDNPAAGTITLTASQSPWNLYEDNPVAIIYWDATHGKSVVFGDERHTAVMDTKTHAYLHSTVGTRFGSGFSPTIDTVRDGSENIDAQISISDGVIWDEDIQITIVNNASPAANWEQQIGPLGSAKIPVLYREGASGTWHKDTATTYPFKYGTLCQYNKIVTGSWTTVDASANDTYINYYIVATNSVTEPIMSLMGQNEYTVLQDAKDEQPSSMSLGNMPFTEFKFLFKIIIKTSSAYTNTPLSYILFVDDYRVVSTVSGGSVNITNHSSLSGLLNDDHPQYLLTNGTRALTGKESYDGTNVALGASFSGLQIPHANWVTGQIGNAITLGEWWPSALNITTTPPGSPAVGDRYLIGTFSGTPIPSYTLGTGTGAFAGNEGKVAEWNGSSWTFFSPTIGTRIGIDSQTNYIFFYGGSLWSGKSFEATTASSGLTKSGFDIQVDPLTGGGIQIVSNQLAVNTSTIVGDGLVAPTAYTIAIDWATTWNSAKAVKSSDLNSTSNGYGASIIGIQDAANYYVGVTVEDALAEIGAKINDFGTTYTVGVGGVTKGDLVHISGNNTVRTISNLSSTAYGIGLAASTKAEATSVKVLSNDTILTGVLVGATAGTKYYWSGSGITSSVPTGSGSHVWMVGIAKNESDLQVEVNFIKKNQ